MTEDLPAYASLGICFLVVVVELANRWVRSTSRRARRPHRDAVCYERRSWVNAVVGLSGKTLIACSPEDCQWVYRDFEQDQRQAQRDMLQKVFGRLVQ